MRIGVAAAAAFGIAGVGVLVWLGAWQAQRLIWKEALIARLELRLSAAPVALPALPDPQRDEFLRVRVNGRIGDRALHVLTSQKPWGPGYRVITTLTGAGGRAVLVDLGYVPQAAKDSGVLPAGPIEVTGALYWPNETDGFTPEPDRAANIWFARDLALMAETLMAKTLMAETLMAETLGAEPVLVVAEAHGGGDWPRPLRLGVNQRNDHLQYAITWFSLALIWAVMGTMLVRRERGRLGEG